MNINFVIFSIDIVLLSTLSFVLLYEGFFVFIALLYRKRVSVQAVIPEYRFAVLIPAHDEEYLIDRCIQSILSADYSEELRDVYVIADNCTDRTVERANSHAVTCLERRDSTKLGKGYAIQWGLGQIRVTKYDAVLFVDADAVVSRNIFRELAKALSRGEKAIQVYNGTLNREDSWLTRVFHLSDVLQYHLYFTGREIVRATCRLIGNGMCLERDLLIGVPWNAFSITENWEYYHRVLLAGYRVAFLSSASANSEQVLSFREGKTQRIRWQAGWLETVKRFVPAMINAAWRRREWKLADAVIDFLLPSPSIQAFLVGLVLIGFFVVEHRFLHWWTVVVVTIAGTICSICLVVSGAGYKDCVALLYTPGYIGWKVLVRICVLISGPPRSWVRTKRKESEAL